MCVRHLNSSTANMERQLSNVKSMIAYTHIATRYRISLLKYKSHPFGTVNARRYTLRNDYGASVQLIDWPTIWSFYSLCFSQSDVCCVVSPFHLSKLIFVALYSR